MEYVRVLLTETLVHLEERRGVDVIEIQEIKVGVVFQHRLDMQALEGARLRDSMGCKQCSDSAWPAYTACSSGIILGGLLQRDALLRSELGTKLCQIKGQRCLLPSNVDHGD